MSILEGLILSPVIFLKFRIKMSLQPDSCRALIQTVKVTVYVTPKKNVLDPQGTAVGHAMQSLEFKSSSDVRVGKTIEFEVEAADTLEFRSSLDKLCNDLLSNPVIEDYRYDLS